MKRFLITGSTGYLGNQIFRNLVNKNISVFGTSQTGAEDSEPCNLLNFQETRDLITKIRPDTIIHCAASVPRDRDQYHNYVGSDSSTIMGNIIQNTTAHIVYTSSMTVYSCDSKMPVNESDATSPQKGYGGSKRRAEIELEGSTKNKYTIVRLPGLFGLPRTEGLIFSVILALLRHESPNVPSNGHLWSAMHVEDAADMCIRASCRDSEGSAIINVGYPGKFSTTGIINGIAEIFGKPCLTNLKVPEFEMDLAKMSHEIGFPKWNFFERIKLFIDQISQLQFPKV